MLTRTDGCVLPISITSVTYADEDYCLLRATFKDRSEDRPFSLASMRYPNVQDPPRYAAPGIPVALVSVCSLTIVPHPGRPGNFSSMFVPASDLYGFDIPANRADPLLKSRK